MEVILLGSPEDAAELDRKASEIVKESARERLGEQSRRRKSNRTKGVETKKCSHADALKAEGVEEINDSALISAAKIGNISTVRR